MVNYILERLPWMFLLENVLGWGQKMCPEETGPSAMETVEKRFLASGIYKVLTLELGTDAWSQGRRTSFFMVGVRSALTDASSDAAQQRFTEKLRAIVLRRAARRPARWDEWLLHPGDSGYCMMLARYASEGQRCKMELAKACKDHAFTYLIQRQPHVHGAGPSQRTNFRRLETYWEIPRSHGCLLRLWVQK